MCRKTSGHFPAATSAPWDKVTVTGPPSWYASSDKARRGFCGKCGSYLFWEEYDGLVYLMAGAFDGETGLRMAGHIFAADRGDYYDIGSDIPAWREDRSSETVEGRRDLGVPDNPATGGCLCGEATYRVTGDLRPVVGCHCQQCRKTSGHFVAATSAPRDTVEIAGDVAWFQSSDAARRGFCSTCGSSLFWDGPGENISIHAGTLNGATGLTLKGHIFCADKGDYYDLDPDLPQFDGDDPDMTTMVT